jgi:hypothetical protein
MTTSRPSVEMVEPFDRLTTKIEPSDHHKVISRTPSSETLEKSRKIANQYSGSGTPSDPYIVSFSSTDPLNPLNLSSVRKWLISLIAGLSTFCVAFSSSAYSGGYSEMIAHFHSNSEVITLGLTLYVIGSVLLFPFAQLRY